ncbi:MULTISPECIES: DUF7344 domain-containing protein [Natrialbaceae]|uniref:DUF7344 domain-containing protein n=1 Tax=Natrialbaceae TaxID=1644061 RepID=UPI00207C416B|nr:hypothetical protein [Natronococcus sp. CG52]
MTDAKVPSLSSVTAYRLLSDPDRRDLLSRLEPGEPTTVDELVRDIATRNRDASIDDVDRTVVRRIDISLVHNHLPRLADHGVITYAPAERIVVLKREFDSPRRLERLLE